ncbi:DUF1403 family protein [Roseobacter fucihabitans]|uniref:DUF1403 family protein n=1 Tax=Roseobacter fucihabitans TaxID=1537242 RepID=UPI0021CC673D|nr:DUF1403 family protein [Roseobacter litoralis]
MTFQPTTVSDDLMILPKLPAWVTSGRAETLETVAFRSGAALTVLDQLVTDPSQGMLLKLLSNRLPRRRPRNWRGGWHGRCLLKSASGWRWRAGGRAGAGLIRSSTLSDGSPYVRI